MLTRILTAIVCLLLLVPLLMFGGIWGACLLFAAICGFSVYEMASCCGLKDKRFLVWSSALFTAFCAVMPAIAKFLSAGALLFSVPCALLCFLVYAVLYHKNTDIAKLLMFFALVLYITAGFTALSALRAVYGLWAVAFALCIPWFTDTFAYFGGMLFGKKKLCPEISPKKTVAGAVCGTIFGTIIGVIVLWVSVDAPFLGIAALPISVMSQFGDLSASLIKRHFGIKDYGKIFPGHGGVLDRFDSVIPSAILSMTAFVGYETIKWLFF